MKYSIQQFLIAVSLACFWLGAVARGNYLLGAGGAVLFGLLATGALFLLGRLLLRMGQRSLSSRLLVSLFVAGVFYVILFPGHVMRDYEFLARTQEYHRQSVRLQAILAEDPRFAAVSVVYVGTPGRRGEWLEVNGSVDNAQAVDELTRLW